ncbi:MAG TPA: hypothetical protein VGC04_00605 [Cellulomonas sp.]
MSEASGQVLEHVLAGTPVPPVVRGRRAAVLSAVQDCYEALLEVDGSALLGRRERHAVALQVAADSGCAPLARWFADVLDELGDEPESPVARVLAEAASTLARDPAAGGAVFASVAAALPPADLVAFAELVSFTCYLSRVVTALLVLDETRQDAR